MALEGYRNAFWKPECSLGHLKLFCRNMVLKNTIAVDFVDATVDRAN